MNNEYKLIKRVPSGGKRAQKVLQRTADGYLLTDHNGRFEEDKPWVLPVTFTGEDHVEEYWTAHLKYPDLTGQVKVTEDSFRFLNRVKFERCHPEDQEWYSGSYSNKPIDKEMHDQIVDIINTADPLRRRFLTRVKDQWFLFTDCCSILESLVFIMKEIKQ